jgi:hypothetical protein
MDTMICEDFATCSNDYETKRCALEAFEASLMEHRLVFDPGNYIFMSGDKGSVTIDICHNRPGDADHAGCALLRWRRVERSGKWEVNGFII